MNNLKVLPNDTEIEKALLGCIVANNAILDRVADVLRPSDFYETKHKKIFKKMLELYSHGTPVDLLTLKDAFGEAINFVGGASYLAEIIDTPLTCSNNSQYAKIIKEKSVLRDIITTSQRIAEESYEPEDDFEIHVDKVEQKLFNITKNSLIKDVKTIEDSLDNIYDDVIKMSNGEMQNEGIKTGFHSLDRYLYSFQNSDFVIIGARPSVGKTTFALDIIRNAAIEQGKPVGFLSLEMSRYQILQRLLSAESEVELSKLKTGGVNESDITLIEEAKRRLGDAPIYIDDTPSPTIMQIKAITRRMKSEHKIKMLVVDYLQLIKPSNSNSSMIHQVTEISRVLKALARELDIPVIALSQLSRAVEQRQSQLPRLSDLRESGSLEQDADIVILLSPTDSDAKVNVAIAKHRNGQTGRLELGFDGSRVKFREIDNRYE